MSDEKQTPTPWRVELIAPTNPEQTFEPVCSIIARDPEFDRDVRIADIPDPVGVQLANAHFICRAVNSHDDLLKACQQAHEWVSTVSERSLIRLGGAVELEALLKGAIEKAGGTR
ncbi:MAG: hypothetical protein WBV94_11870 [Blastocatellia bacterium]